MTSSSSSSPTSKPAWILLIDDNKLGITARKAVLEELGYKVEWTTSPDEGLKRIAERAFDLVVTDYKMPKMNGDRLIAEARKQRPDLRIILLSGFTDALGLDEKTTGADLVIQKSSNEVNMMVRGVRRLLRTAAQAKKPAASQRRTTKSKRKTG